MERTIKEIAVFGAGGFGMEVAMLIEQINEKRRDWKVIGFFDDGVPEGQKINGLPVLGGIDALNGWETELHVSFALGNPAIKKSVIEKVGNPGIHFPTLIHPSAVLGNREYLSIGEGCIICAGSIITTNIRIGRHVILNLACTVGHETSIGDYGAFMPTCNISGEVKIGAENFWGTGAKIINRRIVGDRVTIGAGAVVTENLSDDVTAVGVPARIVRVNII